MLSIYILLGLTVILAVVLIVIGFLYLRKVRKQKAQRASHHKMLLQIIESGGGNVTDNNGNTPLILAIRYGFLDIFKKLLNGKANLNASDQNGNTAMHFAAALNNVSVLKLLTEKEANINARSKSGITPIMVAIKARTFDAIHFLLQSRVNLCLENEDGQNALDYAKIEWDSQKNKKSESNKIKKKQAALLEEFEKSCESSLQDVTSLS